MITLTELAHWEFRCSALLSAVASTERILCRARDDRHHFFDNDIPELEDQLALEKWLLAEAQYKVTLGRLEQEYGSRTSN